VNFPLEHALCFVLNHRVYIPCPFRCFIRHNVVSKNKELTVTENKKKKTSLLSRPNTKLSATSMEIRNLNLNALSD